ncbi:hypothetical protein AOLI_G00282620 [Acnodon oligacanthus]
MKQLEVEILELQRLTDSTGDQSHTADLKVQKSALANLLGFRAQGALVRSRLPKVSEQLNAELERPLDEQELHAAPQSMKGGTAPGIDGLLVEFYKAFWAELGADWLAVLNETLAEGSSPLSCRKSVITLLLKKGGLQDIKNWRPIRRKLLPGLEHQYLWCTLEAFGFSASFIAMVKILYQDIESVLKLNGGLSAPFRVEHCIRQGSALSGMLDSLAIEPLLNRLRSRIEGFILPQYDVQHCISAYADDVMVMVTGRGDIDNLVSALQDSRTI